MTKPILVTRITRHGANSKEPNGGNWQVVGGQTDTLLNGAHDSGSSRAAP